MAKFFIHRPIFAIVISLVILIVGGISIAVLPVARYPDIVPPSIQVQITYPGADAETVAQSIAIPIEQQVNGAENMIYMSSTSTSDGLYNLTVTFAVGTDVDMANVDVNNRVSKAQAKLPQAALSQGITITKQSPNLLMVISVFSPEKTYDEVFLSNYASIQMVDAITRTKGVGNTRIVGQRDYSMRIWLDPEKLAKLGISATDISNVVNEQNILAPAGSIGQPPSKPGTQFQYNINVHGRLVEIEEFNNMIIRTQPDGSVLRMRDVGHVELAAQTYTSFGRLDDTPAALILVYQLSGGNAVDTVKRVRKLLTQMKADMPPGLTYEITLDTTEFITASIENVLDALRDAVILVLIVVLIFLGSVRATFIPMLAVPVSLVGTFGAFMVLGFSINTLTLFAIVLAVGIVVDDAIVVVEAVEAQIEHGLDVTEATEKAMQMVQGPVIAIALVLCAVFVPVAFMGGITGQLYKQFALTLSTSVCLSALVALTLTPALCKMILRPRTESKGCFGIFFGLFNKIFGWVTSIYTGAVRFLIRFAFLALLLLFGIYAGAGYLAVKIPTGFVPDEDQGYIFVSLTLPDGASYERNEKFTKWIADYTRKQPGVARVSTLGGLNILNSTFNSNTSSLVVLMENWKERRAVEKSLRSLMIHVRDEIAKYPEAVGFPILPAPIPGLGTAGGFQFELEDKTAHTADELDSAARLMIAEGNKTPALMNLFTSYRTTVPQINLQIDRDKAKTMGVPINAIFQALQIFLGGYPVNDFNLYDRTFKVMLQVAPEFRQEPGSIKRLYAKADNGQMIPFSTFSKIEEGSGPTLVQRYNMYRTAEISGSSKPGFSSGQGLDTMEELAHKNLPQGFNYEWTGTAFQEKEAGSAQIYILILALIFVFLFLAAQYESWSVPFSVLMGLPVAACGAFFAVNLIKFSNNVYVQIGLVMLLGLAAKNAILIVEFAKERYEKEGMSLVEAAVEGSRVRFRPIMMTSFAFILGVVPLVVSKGAGAASQVSLGIAVFGGMLSASAIGIFFIPMLYVLMQGITNLFTRRKGEKPLTKEEREREIEGHIGGEPSEEKAEITPIDERAMEELAQKAAARVATSVAQQTASQVAERTAAGIAEKAAAQAAEKMESRITQVVERAAAEIAEKAAAQAAEKAAAAAAEKAAAQASEKTAARIEDSLTSKAGEKGTPKGDERQKPGAQDKPSSGEGKGGHTS